MGSVDLKKLLEGREFLSVATSSLKGVPNAAPKFLLKVEGHKIWLVDYTIGQTWRNLRENNRTSISFMDFKMLVGYQLNGNVKIIEKGPKYDRMCKEMIDKEIRLTAQHIIEDVRGHSKHEHFEIGITERFIILEVTINEIVQIGHRGEVVREKVRRA
ncbi:MAG TPA: pyridoxamine 5'-phosphate oxidase family protein [Candidatus Omnitrophota bacterium]|nr:pyridoxamine 5'-phosphate oxidase family protein [Candidatus Omnitrophota bacterium]